MAVFSVGYHANLRSWFTAEQFGKLDEGRRWAQTEWAKTSNITWTAATYPRVTIKPVWDSTAWARAQLNGRWIAISIDEKFRYAWTDIRMWRSLFIHEYGHIFGMKDTRTSGHVMTIYGQRAETPSASEIAWMIKKFGKKR